MSTRAWGAGVVASVVAASVSLADIHEWEYIDPANPSLGRQESAALVPDGAGRVIDEGQSYTGLDFTRAWFRPIQGYVEYSTFNGTNLTDADMVGQHLLADFGGANLTGVFMDGARIGGYDSMVEYGALIEGWIYTGSCAVLGPTVTRAQVESTGSFGNRSLVATSFGPNDLSGVDLSWFDLRTARFLGTNLAGANLNGAKLDGAFFTGSLAGADLRETDGDWTRFTGADLTGVDFRGAVLGADWTGANFTDAIINDATFYVVEPAFFVPREDQIRATASFTNRDLSGLHTDWIYFPGEDLSGFDLTDVVFDGYYGGSLANADLHGAVFTRALIDYSMPGANLQDTDCTDIQTPHAFTYSHFGDARGSNLTPEQLVQRVADFIGPDGHTSGAVSLASNKTWRLWDYDGAIDISLADGMTLASTATLKIVLEDANWGSLLHFSLASRYDLPVVTIDGTLQIAFAEGVDPLDLLGQTFHLFDWTSGQRQGTFANVWLPPYTTWDLSDLYTTGEVTLLAYAPPVCVSDLDADGSVDVFDFGILASHFGQSVAPVTNGDLDGNGFVDVLDFAIFIAEFYCP